ncbi:class I SAM-dependent methyltransferase [Candidatus Woesearchaeota archaeon]|nr:class I SAM-dependent methyltransferase [Candidatus Woesearchaeota archaeon]
MDYAKALVIVRSSSLEDITELCERIRNAPYSVLDIGSAYGIWPVNQLIEGTRLDGTFYVANEINPRITQAAIDRAVSKLDEDQLERIAFLTYDARELPESLNGLFDEITINYPWEEWSAMEEEYKGGDSFADYLAYNSKARNLFNLLKEGGVIRVTLHPGRTELSFLIMDNLRPGCRNAVSLLLPDHIDSEKGYHYQDEYGTPSISLSFYK